MSLSGLVITGFIFVSMFGTKIAKRNNWEGCISKSRIKVCKGDSTVLTPNANCSKNKIRTDYLKICNENPCRSVRKYISTSTDGANKYERKSNSTLVVVNNITVDDTGIYQYRQHGSPKKCCVSLEINCEYLETKSGSSVNLTCKVKEHGATFKDEKQWHFKNKSTGFSLGKSRTHIIGQSKKSDSGNYTCIAKKDYDSIQGRSLYKYYTFVLKVHNSQLITTTKETSQEKPSPSSLTTVFSVPNLMTRKETTPGIITAHMDTTKQETTEGVPMKQNQTEETVTSSGTRANCAISVLLLSQLFIHGFRLCPVTSS